MSIPKRIFYVWGANEKKRRDVELCILSWRLLMPDYEIIEINENSKDYFDFQEELTSNKWFRTVYENKLYAYIADYIRIKVLYDNGGIYLDTDVSTLKRFDKYLEESAFVGMQSDSSLGSSNLEPAILGAQKGSPILKQILDFYDDSIWKLPIYTMPQIFDYVLGKNFGNIYYPPKEKQVVIRLDNITLYPEKYFIPMRAGEKFSVNCIEKETTTIHWFGASWVKDNINYFLKNKHKESLELLVKKCFKEKVILNNLFVSIKKDYCTYSIRLDISYILKFKHKYYGKYRYLIIYVLGIPIKLWKH